MRKPALLLLVLAALAVAGCGGDNDGEGSGAAQTTMPGQVPLDRAFIDAMVPHHQTAIAMAREAKQAGLSDPKLLEIAGNIITSQQAEIEQMVDWREHWFGSRKLDREAAALAALGLSPAEAGMGHSSTDIATADNVNQAFSGSMIGHHTGAIRMAELARDTADHNELKRLAGDIITAQQREIDVIEAYF